MSLFQLPFLSPSSPSISNQRTLLRFTHALIILFETVHFAFDLFYSPQTHHTLLLVRFLFTLASLVFSSTLDKLAEATKSKVLVQYPTVSLLKILALFIEFYSAIELCSPETLYLSTKDTISHILLEGTWKLFLWDQIFPKQFLESHHLLLTIYLFCLGITYQQPFLFTLRVVSQSLAVLYFFTDTRQIQRINHGKNPNLQEEINNIQDIRLLGKALNYLPEGLIIIDSKAQIKFFNKTFQDILKLDDNFGFDDLNQHIFNLKFSNSLSKSEEHQSPNDLYQISSLHSSRISTEKFHNVRSLQDLVNLYMTQNTEFSTVFTAKCNDQQHNLELQFHYISGPNNNSDEKFLLGLIKDSTIFEQKTLLLEKEKLHYRDNLVASFSHELKTPLNSTLGFLEQAMESALIPTEVKQRLIKPALNSGKLLFLLVSDILDYSLILSNQIQLKITPRNPRDTVNHCLELVKLKATQKDLRIILDIEENIPEIINTDHKRFAQVLINLLNNSIQYTFKGDVTVSVSQSSENNLLISVQDTGIGMNKGTQQRVTNSLVQNELEGGNTEESMGIGLGLFISNKLAKMLNPESQKGLGFVSEKDTGSIFYFEIKDHQRIKRRNFEDLSPKRIISGFELEPKTSLNVKIRQYNTRRIKNTFWEYSRGEIVSRPKVLVVDDEIFNITILENICKSCGVSTEKALNGQEALDKLKTGKYSLIFMDINMPVLDGYQATRRIGEMIKKGEMEDVAVIGVTAYVGWNKIEEGYNSGMTEILSKPVSKEVIKNILRKYRLI